jgi:hypothetical protein
MQFVQKRLKFLRRVRAAFDNDQAFGFGNFLYMDGFGCLAAILLPRALAFYSRVKDVLDRPLLHSKGCSGQAHR